MLKITVKLKLNGAMLKITVKLKTEWGDDANMYLQLITHIISSVQTVCKP